MLALPPSMLLHHAEQVLCLVSKEKFARVYDASSAEFTPLPPFFMQLRQQYYSLLGLRWTS